MQFKLTIDLGNDEAMQTRADVAKTLKKLFLRDWLNITLIDGDTGPLFDTHGNMVGRWEVVA